MSTALRIERFNIVGCGKCGAQARWTDAVRGDDGYSLVCGHTGPPVGLLKTIRVERSGVAPPDGDAA